MMKQGWLDRSKRQGGGAGGLVLLLIIILGGVGVYAFVINPDLGEKYTGQRFFNPPQPLEVSAPLPTGSAITLDAVAQAPHAWPQEVTLTKDEPFKLMLNGQDAGEIVVNAGRSVRVLKVEPTGLSVAYDTSRAVVPADSTDLFQRLEGVDLTAPDPAAASATATPTPEADAGPGPVPVRSAATGAMAVVESEIRKDLGTGADVIYKDWTDPVETLYQGKKHWEIRVTAHYMMAGETRKGRIPKNYRAYYRDRKLVAVVSN